MSDSGWVTGSIVRVKLKDFVTYDAVDVTTGPHLNIIIGPNGTGKSTIVCALCLGLGGKTNLLGRARDLSEFIKHGRDRAVIELELYHDQGLNYKVQRIITSDNKSEWKINKRVVNSKEVIELTKKLNIDVNNLCQFLPQDKVSEFVKMTPSQLLESTERAVGGESLVEQHEKLSKTHNEMKTLRSNQAGKETKLDQLLKRQEYLKDIVQKQKERKTHMRKVEILTLKRPWVLYETMRKEIQVLKAAMEEKARKVEQLKIQVQPLQDELDRVKVNLNTSEQGIKDHTVKINATSREIRQIETKQSAVGEKIDELTEEFNAKVVEVQERKSKMDALEREVAAYTQELGDMPDSKQLMEKHNAIHKQVKEVARKAAGVDSEVGELFQEGRERRSKLNSLETQLKKLNDVSNQKMEQLRRFERDTYTAVEWLREHRSEFQGEVLEPIQLSVNVPDRNNAKYLENVISRNDRKAFVFERKDDLNKFMKELRDKKRLTINSVLAPQPTQYKPRYPMEQLQRYGFVSYLSELLDCPPLAKRYLCQYYQIHNTPIGSRDTENHIDAVNKIITSGVFFTPSNRYANKKSRYGSDTISQIGPVREARIFNLTIDMSKVADIQREQATLQAELQEIQRRHDQLKSELAKFKETDATLKKEKSDLQNQIRYRESVEQKIASRRNKIQSLREQNINLDEEKQKKDDGIRQLLATYIQMQSQVLGHYVEFEGLLHAKNQEQVGKIAALVAVNLAEEDLKNSSQELEKAQDELQDAETHCAERKKDAKKLLTDVRLRTGHSGPTEQQKRLFKEFTVNSVEDLDQQLNVARAMADCTGTADTQVIDEFNERQREIDNYTRDVESNQSKLAGYEAIIKKLRGSWYPQLNDMIDKINTKFRSFFGNINCAGEVLLSEHEDYDKWGIDLRVQFRNSDEMKRLTSSYQSGGEKSVSTILYLLSLQGLTECPFRVVDEINQGMDPRNERKVFEMMANVATISGTSQYFLITPKLLPALDYNDKMNILGIFNGEGLEENTRDNLEQSFDHDTLIEKVKIRMSQLTQSQVVA